MITIEEVNTRPQMMEIFEVRRKVFVIEQEVDPKEEYDEFEESSKHFLAKHNGIICGTCRIRNTSKGIKLERFAVLKSYRGKGVGAALVVKCLEELNNASTTKYLHAQLHAIPFYEKYGFKCTGPQFEEAGIQHFKMIID
ncbi:GNAT family N-acetyltransferase [Bacteroidia bacterium]|nr:GNAT family N-acetyltransferase [Bacteroidia bacterium]